MIPQDLNNTHGKDKYWPSSYYVFALSVTELDQMSWNHYFCGSDF
jgi:hypothetical protein